MKLFLLLCLISCCGYAQDVDSIPSALYSEGIAYELDGNHSKAFECYQKASSMGNVEAMDALGNCFYNGTGTSKNFAMAYYWYKSAAKQGNTNAKHNLAVCYLHGNGIEQDSTLAYKWFWDAAKDGDARDQSFIGVWNYEKQNYKEAFYWYKKAALQKDSRAQQLLAQCYFDGKGVGIDYSESIYWYKQSAENGLASSESLLGEIYYYGVGAAIPKDKPQAVYWLYRASMHGDKWATELLNKIDIE